MRRDFRMQASTWSRLSWQWRPRSSQTPLGPAALSPQLCRRPLMTCRELGRRVCWSWHRRAGICDPRCFNPVVRPQDVQLQAQSIQIISQPLMSDLFVRLFVRYLYFILGLTLAVSAANTTCSSIPYSLISTGIRTWTWASGIPETRIHPGPFHLRKCSHEAVAFPPTGLC